MSNSQIVVIGSLNMDMVVRINNMPQIGETILGNGLATIPGGKGANQAIAAARLGAQVSMIGRVGDDDHGKVLISNLKAAGVDTEGVLIDDKAHTGLAFINVTDIGDNSIIVVPGANHCCKPSDVDKNIKLIKKANVVIVQLEIPIETVIHAIETAKKLGKKVILNPAPAANLPADLYRKIDIITPNESELEVLTTTKSRKDDAYQIRCKELLEKGIDTVIVTLGKKGAAMINNNGFEYFPAVKVQAIDTTAAGDSFTAAFAAALMEGAEYEEAIQFANNVAALVATRKGAQTSLPWKPEVKAFIEGFNACPA